MEYNKSWCGDDRIGSVGAKTPGVGAKAATISADLAREGPNFGSQRGLGVSYKKER